MECFSSFEVLATCDAHKEQNLRKVYSYFSYINYDTSVWKVVIWSFIISHIIGLNVSCWEKRGIISVNVKAKKECHMSPELWNFEQIFQSDCFVKKLACERICPRLNITYFFILGKWPTWCTNSFLCIYFYL
jgi:hypothetical protein